MSVSKTVLPTYSVVARIFPWSLYVSSEVDAGESKNIAVNKEITEIIDKVDRPATQIVLEARLIEVSLGDEENVGLDWAKLAGITLNVAEVGSPAKLGAGSAGCVVANRLSKNPNN